MSFKEYLFESILQINPDELFVTYSDNKNEIVESLDEDKIKKWFESLGAHTEDITYDDQYPKIIITLTGYDMIDGSISLQSLNTIKEFFEQSKWIQDVDVNAGNQYIITLSLNENDIGWK